MTLAWAEADEKRVASMSSGAFSFMPVSIDNIAKCRYGHKDQCLPRGLIEAMSILVRKRVATCKHRPKKRVDGTAMTTGWNTSNTKPIEQVIAVSALPCRVLYTVDTEQCAGLQDRGSKVD